MKLVLAIILSLLAGPAFAACSQIPLNVKDGSGNTVAMSSGTANDGACKTYIDADTASQLHSDLTAIFNSLNLATSGGVKPFFVQPAASDNHTNIKNGAGQVYWILAENNSSTVNYLRFYDVGTGFNGCNSATNLISQIQIPASTTVGGINISLPFGIPFTTGISICVSSGYATTDTTNATASAISLTIGYF